MEPVKRMATSGACDRLPEEVVSLVAIKVPEISEDPVEDLHTMRLCNKAMKRATSSRAVTNHIKLENHYQSKVLGVEKS
jgi:hypothetical protein